MDEKNPGMWLPDDWRAEPLMWPNAIRAIKIGEDQVVEDELDILFDFRDPNIGNDDTASEALEATPKYPTHLGHDEQPDRRWGWLMRRLG
jgi:hypothetical protein